MCSNISFCKKIGVSFIWSFFNSLAGVGYPEVVIMIEKLMIDSSIFSVRWFSLYIDQWFPVGRVNFPSQRIFSYITKGSIGFYWVLAAPIGFVGEEPSQSKFSAYFSKSPRKSVNVTNGG